MTGRPSSGAATVIGVALGVACAVLALLVAGAGHGWVSALPFGLLSLILFPIALARLRRFRSVSVAGSCAFLIVALGLDVALYGETLSEGLGYFNRVRTGAILWLVLWCTWQVIVLATMLLSAKTRGTGTRE